MEFKIKDIEQNLTSCLNDSQAIQYVLYILSHIVVATILVKYLKNLKPTVLFGLLCIILIYISFTEKNKIPFYILPTVGVLMYLLDYFVISSDELENLNKTNIKMILKTMWKIPYYGIASYYLILLTR
jgi:hypothetical protein